MKKILIQFAAFFLVIAAIFVLFNGKSDGWIEPAEDEVTGDILLSGQMYSGKLVVNVTLHPDGTGEHDGNGEKTPVTWEKGEGDVAMIVHMNIKETAYDMQVMDTGSGYSAEYPPHVALTLTGKKPAKDIILSGEKYSGKVVVKVTLHPDGTMEHEGNGTVTEGTWEAGTGDVAMIAHFPVKDTNYDMNIIDNGTNYVADYPLVADMQLTGAKSGDAAVSETEEQASPAAEAQSEPTEAPKQESTDTQPVAEEKAEPEFPANSFVLKYVADINEQLTGTFSVPFDTWSAAIGTTGSYAPTESEDVLMSWNSNGKSTEMDFFANGTYEFRYTKMSLAERGTWKMEGGKLTVTTEKGREIEAELIR